MLGMEANAQVRHSRDTAERGRPQAGRGACQRSRVCACVPARCRSQVVLAAAYAPLLVNDNARPWPTNLIVFDNRR